MNQKGLRLLGGSSRFAQAKTTSCGSSKSIICWLRWFVTLRASENNVMRKLEVHGLSVQAVRKRFSVARSAFITAEPPEPFALSVINVLFHHEILRDIVGPAARLFQCIQCIQWFEISCSFVPFVVSQERFVCGQRLLLVICVIGGFLNFCMLT